MYLTEQIRQSVLRPLDYIPVRQQPRSRNIQGVLTSYLLECLNATYHNDDTNQRPCILMLQRAVSFYSFCFQNVNRFSGLIADYLARFRLCGRLAVCRLAGVLISLGASIQSFACIRLYYLFSELQHYVPHKRYGGFAVHTTSIVSGNHNRHHQQEQIYLELKESFSWV